MNELTNKIAKTSALVGGIVLLLLAIATTTSIIGGAVSKLAFSTWLETTNPAFATFLQNTNIKTIPAIYEIMKLGIAFVVFSFLPLAATTNSHAVVNIVSNFSSAKIQNFLISFWQFMLFAVFTIITWRLFFGMQRMYNANIILHELQIAQWYGYAIAFLQMLVATVIQSICFFKAFSNTTNTHAH